MVPVTSMLAAISGKPLHSEPVCRKRKARLTSTALRVLSVERLGRMRTSLKSSLTSVSMRMTDPAWGGRGISSNLVIADANLNARLFGRERDGRSSHGGRIGSVHQPDVARSHRAMDAGGGRPTLQSRDARLGEHEVA